MTVFQKERGGGSGSTKQRGTVLRQLQKFHILNRPMYFTGRDLVGAGDKRIGSTLWILGHAHTPTKDVGDRAATLLSWTNTE